MKKIIAVLLSGVMLASLVLCSCTTTKSSETENTREAGGKEKTETQVEATGTKADKGPAKLDEENIKKVYDYFLSLDPNGEKGVDLYLDGIRGEGYSHVTDKLIYLSYQSNNGDSYGINVMRDTGEVSFSIYTMYGDTGYAANADFPLGGFEEFFDKASADPASIDPYNTSALGPHGEDIKKDLPIIFSRIIAFSDVAFSELGMGFNDLGIDFGDKYRAVDPKQITSKEVEITNDHKFVNGFCTDCGKAWTEYFRESVGKLMDHEPYNNQWITRGQGSSTMLSSSDMIHFETFNTDDAEIKYSNSGTDAEEDISESCHIAVRTYKGSVSSSVNYSFDEGIDISGGGVGFKYQYTLQFSAETGEYDKIFKSKDTFKKYAKVSLLITSDDRQNDIEAWEKMKESDIKKMFEKDGVKYYSKDDLIDRFWDHRENFFASMDSAMVWMKTSLADFGFNWKE